MKAICAALATSLLLASTGAWAQEPSKKDVAEAKSLFKEGIGLYKNGKHAQALEKFRSSYELRPHWKLHLNIGLCYKELAMYTAAKTEFAAFIEEGGGKVNADEKKQVLMELENLEKIIAVLDIDAGPTGAEIQLDGKSQGLAPLDDPIEVDPGSHVLEVSLEGHYPYREEFLVSKGEQKSVQVTLEKEPEEVPDEPVEPVEPVELGDDLVAVTGQPVGGDQRVVHPDLGPSSREPREHVARRGLPVVGDVGLVGDTDAQHAGTLHRASVRVELLDDPRDDVVGHVDVDVLGEVDEAGRGAQLAGTPREELRVEGDAVPADPGAGVEGLEAERLGRGGVDDLPDVDVEGVGELRELVDERDVDRAVGVLEQLRQLGGAGRPDDVDPLHEPAVGGRGHA